MAKRKINKVEEMSKEEINQEVITTMYQQMGGRLFSEKTGITKFSSDTNSFGFVFMDMNLVKHWFVIEYVETDDSYTVKVMKTLLTQLLDVEVLMRGEVEKEFKDVYYDMLLDIFMDESGYDLKAVRDKVNEAFAPSFTILNEEE